MSEKLNLQQAEKVLKLIKKHTDRQDADLVENMIQKAIRYARFRAEWAFMTPSEKAEADEDRTSAHNSFITALKMLARLHGEKADEWTATLDMSDRKRIGDFACWLVAILSIEQR